jgi:hypothetical protein
MTLLHGYQVTLGFQSLQRRCSERFGLDSGRTKSNTCTRPKVDRGPLQHCMRRYPCYFDSYNVVHRIYARFNQVQLQR